MSSARTRTLTVPASGFLRVGERGRWIEIIDGGVFGYRNRLTVVAELGDGAVAGEQDVPCVAGTVVVAQFEELTLQLPVAVADTVIVRIGDGPAPPPNTGNNRIRWLASGTNTTEVTSETIVLDYSGLNARSDYSTRERCDLLDFHGWIVGNKVFRVVATVLLNGVELEVAEYDVRSLVAPTGSSATTPSFACQFFELTSLQRARFPPNLYRLRVVNSSGVSNVDFAYLIGVRG